MQESIAVISDIHANSLALEAVLADISSRDDNDQHLLELISEHGVRYKSPDALADELSQISQQYVFCGHSHVPKTMYLPDGRFIVNVGSVGLPAYSEDLPYPHIMESDTPYADYAIPIKTGRYRLTKEVI